MLEDPAPALLIAFAMVALTALTSLVARRMRVPQAILLVLVGAALAFAPHFPRVRLHPDLVLLVLLPPLLYTSGVGLSWRGFKRNLRPIMLLAVGCVLFTASTVAAAMHYVLHLSWAVGFVLGAVVSPPDAVAPMAIARRLSVPTHLLTILEGEGLVNDATALILFSFAVDAVITGGVSVSHAAVSFIAIVAGEIAWGGLVGWAVLRLRAWTRDSEVELIFALLTPFAAFWPPHFLGGSGVLAAVTAGLYTSWNGPRLISPTTRLQGFFVWGLTVYLVEGVVFFLTGLQARTVMEGPDAGDWPGMLSAAGITVLVVIVVRFVWVFLSRISGAVRAPRWEGTILIGFTGIRGVVSLVAALSVPEMVGTAEFPERDLILFVTFCVIVISLLGQGAMLPTVIRWLKLDQVGAREAENAKHEEVRARVMAIDVALGKLNDWEKEGTRVGNRVQYAEQLRRLQQDRRDYFSQAADIAGAVVAGGDGAAGGAGGAAEGSRPLSVRVRLELLEAERASIAAQFAAGKLSDEARRRIERELDLEDARVRHAADSATGRGFED